MQDGFAVYLLFDPISDDDTKDVQGEFDGDKLSSGLVLGGLGSPDGYNSVEHSCTPSIDETGADHPRVVLSRSLKGSANDGPTSSESDGLDTPIAITEPTTHETTHERTEVVDGNDAALKKGVVDDGSPCYGIRVTELHGGVVVIHCTVDTTHHTLIITEEEDGETSDTVDGDEKLTLLQLVDHIGPGDDIHDGDYPECLEVFEYMGLFLVDVGKGKKVEDLGALLGFGEADRDRSQVRRGKV